MIMKLFWVLSDLSYGLQEKLWKMLKDAVQSKSNIDVVKLHKSEGVVLRNTKYRQKTRSFRIRVSYFSGVESDQLCPQTLV
jgi:polyribonucleotide 5'-hydroxyl-kinase